MDTTATTWLGLTMMCAQCHDHKYDPITQRDYYRLLDAFNRVPEKGAPRRFSTRIRVDTPFLELPTQENEQRISEMERGIAALKSPAEEAIDSAYEGWKLGRLGDGELPSRDREPERLVQLLERRSTLTDEEKSELEGLLRKQFEESAKELIEQLPAVRRLKEAEEALQAYRNDQIPRVMIMSDDRPRETHVLSRGQYLEPLDEVSFSTPDFLPPLPEDLPRNRLGLARWLVSDEHPLTARVQVNRMWQYFFGLGIVRTSEDFGVQSEYPVHRELLDWLAVEFREAGWSRKRMHRLIVTSSTYRQSSRITPEGLARDAENRLYARGSRFRMPAMILRDWSLAASGLLQREVGGAPVYPYQPENVWEPLAITKERDFTYPTSSGESLYRRSLYTFWRRTVRPANMFDSSNRQACRVRRSATSTPLHALTTLNDRTWVEAARVLAEKAIRNHASLDERIDQVFRQLVCRHPEADELERLRVAFEKQRAIYVADSTAAEALLSVGASPRDSSLDPADHAAFSALCLGIMNLDEALCRE